jgi:D-proline reductase (dithiol) PrdB
VGLIQWEIETVGISTIGISIVRRFSEKVKPPRTVFLRWPFGHPLGEPFNVAQQRTVLMAVFNALYSIKTPGEIVDLPFRWKKEKYSLDNTAPKGQADDKKVCRVSDHFYRPVKEKRRNGL